MRAVRYTRYGGPEVLTLVEESPAEPGEGEVLLSVEAASLNALDWHEMRADPAMVRLMNGLRRPRSPAIGVDVAGVVASLGPGVDGLAVGDRVFGVTGRGAFAESTIVRARNIVPVPEGLSMPDAAALPVAGCTALQALRDWGRMSQGARVLVHGASGGVGHLAVQLARVLGASRVDAVTSAANVDFVRELGADDVLDYGTTDVTTTGERYDVIVDTVLTHAMTRMQALLASGGTLAIVGMIGMGSVLGPLPQQIRLRLASRAGARIVAPFAQTNREDIELLAQHAAEGRVQPHIEQVYPLEDVAEAMTRLEGKHVRGKLVVLPHG